MSTARPRRGGYIQEEIAVSVCGVWCGCVCGCTPCHCRITFYLGASTVWVFINYKQNKEKNISYACSCSQTLKRTVCVRWCCCHFLEFL